MKSYAMPLMVPTTGYIYFIQMDRIGPIKIGFTKDLGKRLVGLQVSSPYPLRLLCLFPGNEKMEREIHDCYRDMWMQGEWYLPHPFILKEIEEFLYFNRIDGFIEPIAEYDLDFGVDNYEKYFNHLGNAIFDWKGFHASEDYQTFKREADKEVRDKILDKYITGYYPEESHEEPVSRSL